MTCWPELMKNDRKNMKLSGQNPKNLSFSHDLVVWMPYIYYKYGKRTAIYV